MSIHNVDEVLWLSGKFPTAAASLGSRLYAHRRSTAEEDYDDALMLLQFDRELRAQIEVSRNHVSGYRTETWIFGEKGRIQIGRFEQDPSVVRVEAYGASECIESRGYPMPSHGEDLPEFVGRFGPAYKAELADFVDCCARGAEFAVTHRDALQAMEVIELADRRVLGLGPRVQ
jgi:predicted dehydrogenase